MSSRGTPPRGNDRSKPFSGAAGRLCLAAFSMFSGALMLSAPSEAQPYLGTTDTPVPWSSFCTDAAATHVCGQEYHYDGDALRDYENEGGFSDPSAGATPNGAEDISSGFTGTPNVPDSCNPQVPGGSANCGLEPSAYFGYCENCDGTGRDYIFLRMRVNGDPRQKEGFRSSHWNFLHDVDNDGFKEYWMDVDGGHSSTGPDRLRLLYQDTDTQTITNDQPAKGAGVTDCASGVEGGTLINEFVACNNNTDPGCENSFTRAVEVGDGTGEWWIDMQMPLDVFTLADGCGPGGGTWQAGTTNDVEAAQGLRYMYTTSNSGTDPLQKDRTAPGFGDQAPVTLAWVRVGKHSIEWATATETANVGFRLFALVDGEEVRVDGGLIPSAAGDSVHPIRYEHPLGTGSGAEAYYLEDVDRSGHPTRHGPFRPGEEHGSAHVTETVLPIDWDAVRSAGSEGRSAKVAMSLASPSTFATAAELFVSEDGLHRVTYEDLLAAGVDLSVVPADDLSLTLRGEAVPLRVVTPPGRSLLGPGGFVELYGEAAESLYTRENVYRLGAEAGKAMRVGQGTAAAPYWRSTLYRANELVERDLEYTFGPPQGAGPWYWDQILASDGAPKTKSYTISVDFGAGATPALIFFDGFESGSTGTWGGGDPPDDPDASAPPILTVDLWGITNFPESPDHHVLVSVNGTQVGEAWFDGLIRHSIRVALPGGLVQDGDNTVTLTVPGDTGLDFDLVYLDRIAIEHPRVAAARDGILEVLAPTGPVTAVGYPEDAEVVAWAVGPSGVSLLPVEALGGTFTVDPGEGATRVLFSAVDALKSPSVLPARAPRPVNEGPAQYLIVTREEFREALGPLVDARRAQGWSVQVVDVEDLYLHYTHGIVDPAAITDHLRFAIDGLGTQMVLLVGGDTYDYLDNLGLGSVSYVPTMYTRTGPLVGYTPSDSLLTDTDGDRIPDLPIGRLPVRTVAELEHMIDKTLAFESAQNRGTAVFAADEAAPGFDFDHESRTNIASYLSDWSVAEAYLDEMSAVAAHDLLIGSLESGVALAHFFGHSGPGIWTYKGLLSAPEAKALTNADPSLVLQWGCWNTYFVDPVSDSMGTAFLLASGGAAATMGASALTGLPADRDLAGRLLERLTTPGTPIGVALHEAQRDLALTHPHHEDVILGWLLLGDPAVVLQR